MIKTLDLNQNRLGERLYFFSLVLYLIVNFMAGTTFSRVYGLNTIVLFLRFSQFAAFLALVKVFFLDQHDLKKLLVFGGGLTLLFVVCKQARELDPFFITCFMLGAYKIVYQKILKTYLITELSLLFGVYGATLLKLIPNNILWREGEGIPRAGLGLASPSDLASHIFYVMLAYAIYRDFKLNRQELVYLSLIATLVFAVTNSRLDALLMLLLLGMLRYQRYLFYFLKKIGALKVSGAIMAYAGLDLLLTYAYAPMSSFYQKLDILLSRRLFFGKIAFDNYPLRLFGQYIYQNGTGDPRGYAIYYFIDSAFIQALMMFGIVFFVGMLCLLDQLVKRSFQVQVYSIVAALLLVVLSMAINHHFWSISYNILPLAACAQLGKHLKADRKELELNSQLDN